MATKAKTAKKTTLKDKIAFLERQCEQLGKERNQFAVENAELKTKCANIAFACDKLQVELDNLKAAGEKKSSRNWVLRKLGL